MTERSGGSRSGMGADQPTQKSANGSKRRKGKGGMTGAGQARKSSGQAPGAQSARRAKSPRELAMDTLVKVSESGAYSNLQLNRTLQDAGLPKADAGLVTELVYGTIQRQLTLDYWLERFVTKGLSKLAPWVHQLLRMSAYQLLYLDRIPAHAAVNEAVAIAKKRGHAGISGMVNGVLRSLDRSRAELVAADIVHKDPIRQMMLRYSYPKWLVRRWSDAYGKEAAEAICAAGNAQPAASLRVNTVKNSREDVLSMLIEAGITAEASELAPAGIVTSRAGNLADTAGFREGLWTMQDISSMLVAEVVAPRAGMQVLDCCAAPGGKSTHMAELMGGKGKVWANDVHAHKRELITAQTERLGLRNVEAIIGDALKLDERFKPASLDAVLLDAPCSGFGVIKRKPEIKWTKTEGDIEEIAALQHRLLQAVHSLVKPGGVLVYSTCTMEPAENERQVERFLEEHPEFERDADWPTAIVEKLRGSGIIDESFAGEVQLLPQHFDSDGFFIAKLRKHA